MAYSPKLFLESYPSIVQCVSNISRNISDFKYSMATAAGKLNAAIADINSESNSSADFITQTKRDLRSCRENYMKTLACSTTFVDRFNKLLRYADMDGTWKGKMVEAASNGDYKSFSDYVTQLQRFLDQLSKTYQDFVQQCADAEAQCGGIPEMLSPPPVAQSVQPLNFLTNPVASLGAGIVAFGVSRYILGYDIPASIAIGEGVFIASELFGANPLPPPVFRTHPGLSLGAGLIAFGLSYLLLGYEIPASIAIGVGASIVVGAASYIVSIVSLNRELKNSLPQIQYKGYDSLRSAASAMNSSGLKFHKVLRSLDEGQQSRLQVKEHINAASFNSALDSLLAEIRKAYEIVNPCYEELDTQIEVIKVKNY